MWPFVTPCSTRWWCLGGSASCWLPSHTSAASPQLCGLFSCILCDLLLLNIINHFYRDVAPLLALACSDTSFPETFVFISAATDLVFSIIIVLVSYFNIVLSILKIRLSEGRKKAFPHVRHIWWQCLFSMGRWYSCMHSLKLTILWILIKWPLCFILWWFPCWTP